MLNAIVEEYRKENNEQSKADKWLRGQVTDRLLDVATEKEKTSLANLMFHTAEEVKEISGYDKDMSEQLLLFKLMKRARAKEQEIEKKKRNGVRSLKRGYA